MLVLKRLIRLGSDLTKKVIVRRFASLPQLGTKINGKVEYEVFHYNLSRVGIIGVGTMGREIGRCLARNDKYQLEGTVRQQEKSQKLDTREKFTIHTSNLVLASRCSIIILAVKPHQVSGVCREISHKLNPETLLLSVAAGVNLSHINCWAPVGIKVRAMPNLPIAIGSGSVALYTPYLTPLTKLMVENLFTGVSCCWLDREEDIEVATAVSGCAPAYLSYFIELMIQGATNLGLTRAEAKKLIIPTLIGTGLLLKDSSPNQIIRRTACKGGATEQAMEIFKRQNLAEMIANVQAEALKRIKEIQKNL